MTVRVVKFSAVSHYHLSINLKYLQHFILEQPQNVFFA
jgi:hypothetical protein